MRPCFSTLEIHGKATATTTAEDTNNTTQRTVLDHLFLFFHLYLRTSTKQRKCQMRMSALLEWKVNHPYFEEEEEEEEDNNNSTSKRSRGRGGTGGGSSRRRSEMIN